MTQYDPLLPQTSDAFFSSTISIPPYLLPLLLVTLVFTPSSSHSETQKTLPQLPQKTEKRRRKKNPVPLHTSPAVQYHHILLPYYDYYYYYYPTLSPTITTTNTPRHLPVPLIYSSSPSSMTRHPPLPQLQHRNPISYSSSSPSTTSPAVQYLYILHLQPTLLLPHTYYHNYDCSFDNYSSSPSISPPHHPIVKHRRQCNTEDRKRSHRE